MHYAFSETTLGKSNPRKGSKHADELFRFQDLASPFPDTRHLKPETFLFFITPHVDSTRLDKNKTQPAICKPAMKNANMKRILVRGMMPEGVFQCLTIKYIARGAVKRVTK
jgi:hypothetical protein